MIKQKILNAYEKLAHPYNRDIDHKPHNAYYDRPNTIALFGELERKIVLDAACGPGKYAEELIHKGAIVSGFDLSPKMIEYAKQRNGEKGRFFIHDMSEPLSMFEDSSFDYVLCALAMHYLEDWGPTMREFCRVLKPKGQLIISIENPFFEYTYFKSKKYFEVEHVKVTWKGFGIPVEVNSYRRPLHMCIDAFTENGFYIDKLVEPLPTEEFEVLDPRHFKELNEFPAFLCLRGVKK